MSETQADRLLKKASACLIEATSLDEKGKKNDAWRNYVKGIDLLIEYKKLLPEEDGIKKKSFDDKIVGYITRAEKLKAETNMEVASMEQRKIQAGSTGHSYEVVFAKCFDGKLTEVTVQDAYIQAHHQVLNFVRFCELCVAKAHNLRYIRLTTGVKAKANEDKFDQLESSLKEKKIKLTIQYHPDLHDREIRFNNGWIVKIGRGLDYFRNPGPFAIGQFDLNQKPCHETTIDIIRLKNA